MGTTASSPFHALRRASRLRALLLALITAIAGAQIAIQAHLVAHDLWPSTHQVCEQCVLAKVAAPLPTVAGMPLVPAGAVPLPTPMLGIAPTRGAALERNRGPPTVA